MGAEAEPGYGYGGYGRGYGGYSRVVMEVMAVDTARGRPRLSPATAMAVMAADMVVTAVVVMEVTGVDTARGRPRLSLATAMVVMAAAMVAMVVTAVAMAATGVSYHRRS